MQHFHKAKLNLAIPQALPKAPVAVKLYDGTILSLSDLPPRNTARWVASAKAAVIRVFMAGLVSKEALIDRYSLSTEEFESWLHSYLKGGNHALKITNIRES